MNKIINNCTSKNKNELGMVYLRQKINSIKLTGIKVKKIFENSTLVKTLKIGDAFGDVGLRYNLKRMASAKCSKDSIFATLTRENYNNIINIYHHK